MAKKKTDQPNWDSQGMKYRKAVDERERLKSHLELQAQFQLLCKEPWHYSQPRYYFALGSDGNSLPNISEQDSFV